MSGYSNLTFGRISVQNEEHLWARYAMGWGVWTKKYLIVLAGVEYDLTATCKDQKMLSAREPVWDAVAASFIGPEILPRSVAEILMKLAKPAPLSDHARTDYAV